MARYTCSYLVKLPIDQIQPSLKEILQSCNFDVLYQTGDYLMAREIPGEVAFTKLVRVEVLTDTTTATPEEVQVNFVVKNEELPLQLDNHCRQMFNLVTRAIANDNKWQLLENPIG